MKQFVICFFFLLIAASLNASWEIEATGGVLLEHMKRARDGGSQQDGTLVGSTCSLVRKPKKGIYFSFLYRNEEGDLYGKTGLGDELVSHKRDQTLEGTFGYSLPLKKCFTCTPFLGKGRLVAKNFFRDPSPIDACYDVRYNYFAYGMRFDWQMKANICSALVIKGIFSDGAVCKVRDFEEGNIALIVEDNPSCDIELPIEYTIRGFHGHLRIGVTPFYRYRHWGGHENYPYDFFDTKFYILGSVLNLSFHF